MRISALRRRSALITLGRRMWSISVGSGGTGPLVMTQRPEPAGLSSGLRPSASIVDSPELLSSPKISCWRGRRRSASSTIVWIPMLAERDREVGDDGRLALLGLGARDLDHADRLVHQELEVGAQRAIALLQVDRRPSDPRSSEVLAARQRRAGGRSRPSTGASVWLRDVGGGVDAAAELLEREREQAAGEQAEHAGDAEQQRRARLDRGEVRRRRVDERRDRPACCRRSSPGTPWWSPTPPRPRRAGSCRARGDAQDAAAALRRGVDVGAELAAERPARRARG